MLQKFLKIYGFAAVGNVFKVVGDVSLTMRMLNASKVLKNPRKPVCDYKNV